MSTRTVTAFCPGHISGYFRRIEGDIPASTGSIGAGIVISEGVTATVSPSESVSVTVKRNPVHHGDRPAVLHDSPPIVFALENLGIGAAVLTECSLPISAGFGLSAAALLATLTAANRLLDLGLSGREIALCAHEAEVVHRTGLGDVAACQGGGRVVRMGPGIDAAIERSFDLSEPLFAVSFGPIHTPSVLGSPEQMARVAGAFPRNTPKNPAEFFDLARRFSYESGLVTPEVENVLTRCSDAGVPASMTMLGNGVFACGSAAEKILAGFGNVYRFRMAEEGVRITGEN